MSIFKSLVQRYQQTLETTDNHKDNRLQTRYYKTSRKNVLEEMKKVLEKREEIEVLSISEERGEISANIHSSKKTLIIITIIQVLPNEIAVDFTISTTRKSVKGSYPALRDIAITLYKELDQLLPVKKETNHLKK